MTTITDTNIDKRLLQLLGQNLSKKEERPEAKLKRMILQGYPYNAFESVLKETQLHQKQLSEILGIAESTLARRKRNLQPLTALESDRLYRFARTTALAFLVFGDESKALTWMKSPNKVLEGQTPFTLLETEVGTSQVEDELNRILYGIYI